MKKLFLIAAAIAVCFSTYANATPIFTENFESGNLNQWTGKTGEAHHGQIVGDPLAASNQALNFTQLNSAGDIFTSGAAFAAGIYTISFDYLGYPTPSNNDSGGYVGISDGFAGSHKWLWATGTASGAKDVLIDDGAWHSYEYTITAGFDFHLMLEDFSGSGGVAGDAYFDNIQVSAVPEPGTILLLGLGLVGVLVHRRKIMR